MRIINLRIIDEIHAHRPRQNSRSVRRSLNQQNKKICQELDC